MYGPGLPTVSMAATGAGKGMGKVAGPGLTSRRSSARGPEPVEPEEEEEEDEDAGSGSTSRMREIASGTSSRRAGTDAHRRRRAAQALLRDAAIGIGRVDLCTVGET